MIVAQHQSSQHVVIHFCTTTAAALRELPFVLAAQPVPSPQTPLGSNQDQSPKSATVPLRKPQAIFVGAGFAQEDYEAFRREVEAELDSDLDGVVWVREEKSDIEGLEDPGNWTVVEGLGKVPRPEVLIQSVGKCLGRVLGDGR